MRKFIMGSLAASLLFSASASAQFTLDSRYTDSDGDLTADTPKDASKQIDPSTLIFAYTPVERD
ncbi:MAG: phosphate/phosphite/phosphonate ABC transporter substrate-binding protein, partial [Orrella sp.]